MSREKQIEELKAILLEDCGSDCENCEFYKMKPCYDNYLANRLYNAGYRKQSEGEWVYKFTLDGDRFYECSVCGRQEVVNCLCKERNLAEDRPYCHCGAKMKGGAE